MIKGVIFDIGNVLVNFNPLGDTIAKYLPQNITWDEFETDVKLEEFGCGKFSSLEFYQLNRDILGGKTDNEIRDMWNSIGFTPVKPMFEFIDWLRANKLKVYLLSNTIAPHVTFLEENFNFSKITDDAIYSNEVGLRKPDHAIYNLVEIRFGLKSNELVFIDDLEENIFAARKCGWKTVHHSGDPEKTIEQVKSFLERDKLR
jgi:putative hydrolase of the HAD superfamily